MNECTLIQKPGAPEHSENYWKHNREGLRTLKNAPDKLLIEMYTKQSKQDIADAFGISVCAVSNRLRQLTCFRSPAEANRVRYRKNVVVLTAEQEQLVYGSLLGDACLYRQQKLTHFTLKVGFAHGQDQLLYLEYKRSVIGGSRISQRPEGSNFGKPVYQFAYSNTQGLLAVEAVTKLNGIKRVSEAWLQKLKLPGIAYWYQDDGSIYFSKTGKVNRIVFHTNSFSDEELEFLIGFLKVHGLSSVSPVRSGVANQKTLNAYKDEELREFLAKLKPYSIPCLCYKFPV